MFVNLHQFIPYWRAPNTARASTPCFWLIIYIWFMYGPLGLEKDIWRVAGYNETRDMFLKTSSCIDNSLNIEYTLHIVLKGFVRNRFFIVVIKSWACKNSRNFTVCKIKFAIDERNKYMLSIWCIPESIQTKFDTKNSDKK